MEWHFIENTTKDRTKDRHLTRAQIRLAELAQQGSIREEVVPERRQWLQTIIRFLQHRVAIGDKIRVSHHPVHISKAR